jgi:hypothetical protein
MSWDGLVDAVTAAHPDVKVCQMFVAELPVPG